MADRNLIIDLIMGVEETTSHRVRKFGYGDGYEQIQADGINTKVREYNITTIPFTLSEALTLKDDLDQVCVGDFFKVTKANGLPPFITNEVVRFRLVDNKYTLTSLPASDKFQFTFAIREAFSG
tara:strand:+ start:495 stop:866 length:372 start_codon:yes stop_codon:yes gene_type:complete